MNSLPVDLLETLVAFSQTRTVQGAAELRGLTQPAVTQHLKKLESASPQRVFEAQGRRKLLTAYGEALASRARSHLTALRRDLHDLELLQTNPKNSVLRLGGRREILNRLVPRFNFKGKLVISAMSGPQAVREVLQRSLDIAISRRPPDSADLIARPLFTDHACICVHRDLLGPKSADTASVRRKLLNPEFLRTTPALCYRENSPELLLWLRKMRLKSQDIRIRTVCDDWNTLVRLVEQGQGWCVLPSSFKPESDVVTFDIPHAIVPEAKFYIIFGRALKSAPGLRDFIKSFAHAT